MQTLTNTDCLNEGSSDIHSDSVFYSSNTSRVCSRCLMSRLQAEMAQSEFFSPSLICDSDLFLVQWRQHKSHAIRLFFSSSDLGWFHMRSKHRSYVLQCDLSFNSHTENHVTLWPVCLAQGVSCRVSNPKPDALLSVNIVAMQTATTVLCLVAVWHAIVKININTTYWLVQRYFFCEIKFNV